MDLTADLHGSQDWFLCSQCKRAFHSKIQLYQHKRMHYIEEYHNAQEDLKRKRVEEWVMQVQLQLQNGGSEKNNYSPELGKENSDVKYSEESDLPGPSQGSSSLLEEEAITTSLTKGKRKKKARSTLAPVSNRVMVSPRRRISKPKKPVKTVKAPARINARAAKLKTEKEVIPQENKMVQDVRVVVILEEYKLCEDCRGTFLTSKEYSDHLPCTDVRPRSVQLSRQTSKRKATVAGGKRSKRRRN